MEYTIYEQDKFLKKNKKKFGTKEKDAKSLEAKEQNMTDILKGINKAPNKLHIIGPLGKEKVKATMPRANTLHGKDGKNMVETKEKDYGL